MSDYKFKISKGDIDYFLKDGQAELIDQDKNIVKFDGWFYELVKDKYVHIKDPNAPKSKTAILREEALERQIRKDEK